MTYSLAAELSLVWGCVLLIAVVIGIIVWRAPQLTIFLLLVQVLLSAPAVGFNPTVVLFGYHWYITDVFSLYLLGAAAIQRLLNAAWTISDSLFTFYAVLMVVGTFSYSQIFAFKTSITQHREWLYGIAFYFWMSSQKTAICKVYDVFILVALVAATLQNTLYLRNGFGSSSAAYYDPDLGWISIRPLYASGALILLCGLIALVMRPGRWSLQRSVATIYLLSSVLLSQHRSVWVATIAATVVWILAANSQNASRVHKAFFAAILTAILGFFLFIVQGISSAISDSATNTGTLTDRTEYWTERLAVDRSVLEWFLGGFFGPSVVQLDPRFTIAAHNMYVELLSTVGILGLIVFIAFIFSIFPSFKDHTRTTLSLMIIAVSVFGLFYSWPAWCFLLLGLGTFLRPTSTAGRAMSTPDLGMSPSRPSPVAAAVR